MNWSWIFRSTSSNMQIMPRNDPYFCISLERWATIQLINNGWSQVYLNKKSIDDRWIYSNPGRISVLHSSHDTGLPNYIIPSLDPPGKKFRTEILWCLWCRTCGAVRHHQIGVPWRVPPYPGGSGTTSYIMVRFEMSLKLNNSMNIQDMKLILRPLESARRAL